MHGGMLHFMLYFIPASLYALHRCALCLQARKITSQLDEKESLANRHLKGKNEVRGKRGEGV